MDGLYCIVHIRTCLIDRRLAAFHIAAQKVARIIRQPDMH